VQWHKTPEPALAGFFHEAPMSTRAYSEINLHFVWHVKANLPIIDDILEPGLYRFIRNYALKTKGLIFHEVGRIETHVHIAVTIPPTLLISEWIGQVKGASSHYVNHQLANRKLLDWQGGYGVVSFGTRDLGWVINYIRNQKEHHKKGTTVERLERITHEAEDES
jgi:putative transposase